MTTTANCRICGAEFKASKTGRTVHCPRHRGRSVKTSTRTVSRTVMCRCGKTVFVDGFGARTPSADCPQCGDSR